MRKIAETQVDMLKKGVGDLKIDIYCRDEVPTLLLGLQLLYTNTDALAKILKHIAAILPKKASLDRGRPGLSIWQIMVLGYIRLSCNCDYDKLADLATNHKMLRLFLHEAEESNMRYARQTLVDNVSLFTLEILGMVNDEIVKLGHFLVGSAGPKECRIDSFVVETNVHFPTDLSLMWDGYRTILRLCSKSAEYFGIGGWREAKSYFKKGHRLYRECQLVRKGKPTKDATKAKKRKEEIRTVTEYIRFTSMLISKAKQLIPELRKREKTECLIRKIESFIEMTTHQINLLNRRIINEETIPAGDKIHSLFESHTEWICKGKIGKPQELGVRVALAEDEFGFIIGYRIMFNETDEKVTLPMAKELKEKYPTLNMFSFDKGFYTPENKTEIEQLVDMGILPKKGKMSSIEKEKTKTPEYIKYRHKHSRIESAINAVENHGLDRCPDHGKAGFERYVALAIAARNVLQIGRITQNKMIEEAREKRQIA